MQDQPDQEELNKGLFYAAHICDPAMMRKDLAAGANPNARFSMPMGDGEEWVSGVTALHALMICSDGMPADRVRECVDILVKANANIEAVNSRGDRPIHETVRDGYFNQDGLNAILEAGADVNAPGENGFTALHYTMGHLHSFAARVLLAAGAKKDVWSTRTTEDRARTPLMLARHLGNDVMQKFMAHTLNAAHETPDVDYVKEIYGLDLTKRRAAMFPEKRPTVAEKTANLAAFNADNPQVLAQQRLNEASERAPLAKSFENPPTSEFDFDVIAHDGRIIETEIKKLSLN